MVYQYSTGYNHKDMYIIIAKSRKEAIELISEKIENPVWEGALKLIKNKITHFDIHY